MNIEKIVKKFCERNSDIEQISEYIYETLKGSESSLIELLDYVRNGGYDEGYENGFISGQNNMVDDLF